MPKTTTKTTTSPHFAPFERSAVTPITQKPVTAFPTGLARVGYRSMAGKPISPHGWKVYDYICKIPRGKVSTYGLISNAIGSSAQAVGNALRSNPFQPLVPCHRVIATTLFIGGFQGTWAQVPKVTPVADDGEILIRSATSEQVEAEDKILLKLRLLEEEGVRFDEKGFLVGGKGMLWDGKST